MSLGKRIAKLREKQNLTQKELAEKISLTRQALSLYEIDKREPDNNTLNRLADFFCVSLDYLLGRTDESSEYTVNKNKDYSLKERLRRLRVEKKLTQEDIAKLVNIKKQEYSSYERGVVLPDKVILHRIAFHLNTTIEYLLCETDSPIVSPKKEVSLSGESSFLYLAGSDGKHKIIVIPKEQEERFNKLVEAGMPELLDEEKNRK